MISQIQQSDSCSGWNIQRAAAEAETAKDEKDCCDLIYLSVVCSTFLTQKKSPKSRRISKRTMGFPLFPSTQGPHIFPFPEEKRASCTVSLVITMNVPEWLW